MRIIIAVGCRPDYIKAWPVYQAFVRRGIEPIVVATGQHHDILKQQQDILPMPIGRWLLDIQPNLPLGPLFEALHKGARTLFVGYEPDAVFVVGDTTSSLAVAQAAFHLGIPVAHIEAGMRSGDIRRPYPEEFNRIGIDALSTYLFAPTAHAARICKSLNPRGRVCVTGNTVIDSLVFALTQISDDTHPTPYLLLDLHRRETDAARLRAIVERVLAQAQAVSVDVVWPAHPRPEVQSVASALARHPHRPTILGPQPYLNFIKLMRQAQLILTDSGGVVEEAITLGTPTLQLRDATDRQEAIDCQGSWLAGTDPDQIERLLKIAVPYAPSWKARMQAVKNPYGDGHAGEKTVAFFLEEFNDVS